MKNVNIDVYGYDFVAEEISACSLELDMFTRKVTFEIFENS